MSTDRVSERAAKPVGDLSDASLVRAAVLGDDRAFAALVERHRSRIRRFVAIVCGRSFDEEMEQEVLVTLYLKLPSYRGDAAFTTWLYRLVRNRCIDLIRQQRTHERYLRRLARDTATGPTDDPERQAVARIAHEQILAVVQELPFKDRQLFALREIEKLPVAECAQILRAPVGTVKARLHRLRKKLSVLIDERGLR